MENIIINSSLPNNRNYDYRGGKNKLEIGDAVYAEKQEDCTVVTAPVSYYKNDKSGDISNTPIYQQKIEITEKGFTKEMEMFENSVKYNKDEVIHRKKISKANNVFSKSEKTYNNSQFAKLEEIGVGENGNYFTRKVEQKDIFNYTDEIHFFDREGQETLSLNLIATTKELNDKIESIAIIEENRKLIARFGDEENVNKYFHNKFDKKLEENNINLNF